MFEELNAKLVDEMTPTQKATFLEELFREGRSEEIESRYAISSRSCSRYRRLCYLIPEMGRLLDQNKLPFLAAVEISFLSKNEQKMIYDVLMSLNVQLCRGAASKLRKKKGRLSAKMVEEIVRSAEKNCISEDGVRINLSPEICRKYFLGMNHAEMTKKIEQALAAWLEANSKTERLLLFKRLYANSRV